jgi:hypothetical protein
MGGPKFWRDRAAEARRLADRTLDPRSKFILSKLAEEYEELARFTRANGWEKASATRAKQTARKRDDALSLAQEPEAALAQEPEAQSLADSVPSQSGSRIRRTTYWVGDKPVSLVYIPALADEHPETINDERPPTNGWAKDQVRRDVDDWYSSHRW